MAKPGRRAPVKGRDKDRLRSAKAERLAGAIDLSPFLAEPAVPAAAAPRQALPPAVAAAAAAPLAPPPPRFNTAAPLRVALAPNVNAGPLPQAAPEPLVLPYIPDQTSYAGRNYMDMALSSDKFVPQISVDRNGNVITPKNAPAGIFAASALSDPASSLSVGNPVTPEITTITYPGGALSGQTAEPTLMPPGQSGAGGSRSRMTYSGVAVPTKQGVVAGTGGTATNLSLTKFTAQFDVPSNNQTIQVAGNSASFTVSVILNPPETNQSRLSNPAAARLPTCTVRLDGATNIPMTVTGPDESGMYTATSNAALTFNASGPHTLAAQAAMLGEHSNPTVNFAIQLDVQGGGGNVTPPTLTVTSPLDGSVIAAQFGDPSSPAEAVVTFTGSATPSPGADIASIQIQIGNDPSTASSATPDPAAGWSKWSGEQVLVGYGDQDATITLVDSAHNTVTQAIKLVLAPFEPRLWLYSKLLIIEEVRLTNYSGQYGRGKVLRTLSLLPGESTNISVSSYSTSETTTTDTTSIFDELNDTTSSDFDTSVANEQADKSSQNDSETWGVNAKASASWGWGSAEVTGNYKSDSNSAREDLRKSVKSATLKHAAERSSRRTVQVNAENQQTITSGTTQSIQRTISNINVSRTLNFIFYQLNQEYISLLHLVDVRIGYVSAFLSLMDGTTQFDYQEVTLTDLPTLISKAIKNDFQAEVIGNIGDVLSNVVDYADVLHPLTETKVPVDETGAPVPEAEYFRFRRDLAGTWTDPNTGVIYTVPGVILGVNNVTMRTDGVLVDSALGQSPALDDYSAGLQTEVLRQKKIANDAAQQVIDLVNTPVAAQTDAWQKTHPCCQPSTLSIAAVPPTTPGANAGAGNPLAVGGAGGG